MLNELLQTVKQTKFSRFIHMLTLPRSWLQLRKSKLQSNLKLLKDEQFWFLVTNDLQFAPQCLPTYKDIFMNILIIVITMILRWCSIFCIDKSGVICLLKRYCNNRRTLCTMIRLGFTLKYSFTQWLAFSALLAAISSRCKLVHRKVLLL